MNLFMFFLLDLKATTNGKIQLKIMAGAAKHGLDSFCLL